MQRMSISESPPPAAPVPAPLATAASPGLQHWTSRALLAGRREALIDHEGSLYRLRVTASGKLILTK